MEEKGPKLKIMVDRGLCIGAASCVEVAPEVFQLDEENIAIVVDPWGTDRETILDAASSCPVDAITLIDEETGKQIYPSPLK